MEKLQLRRLLAPVSIALGSIMLTACSGDVEGSQKPSTQEQEEAAENLPITEVEFLPNGNRIIRYKEAQDSRRYADVLQTCDGPDLLEQTALRFRSGNAMARTKDHDACEDGVLTKEDFTIRR